jgi:hypothetical protein
MLVGALIIVLSSASAAHAQSATADRSRARVLWAVAGGGAGFGIGLWAGLTAFDDAVNSDRKVWTSAVVGAGVGAAAGYLIGRAHDRSGRAPAHAIVVRRSKPERLERQFLDELARSIKLHAPIAPTTVKRT